MSSENNNGFFSQAVKGIASSLPAAYAVMPMITLKNKAIEHVTSGRKARGEPFVYDRNILSWYRGVTGFSASFVPTTLVQMVATEAFSEFFSPGAAAASGGMASAVAVGPAEFVLIQQGKRKSGFVKTVQYMVQNHGIAGFYKGFTLTAGREGVFTYSYMELAPKIKEWMREKGASETQSNFMGGPAAGVFAAIVSQPLDVLKTRMQQEICSMKEAKAGFKTVELFTGVGWRMLMVSTAIGIMSYVQSEIKKFQ